MGERSVSVAVGGHGLVLVFFDFGLEPLIFFSEAEVTEA